MTAPLELMGISETQARAAVRFLEAYARTVLGELEEASSGATGRAPLSWDDDPVFGMVADAASALREAAQWLTYLSPADALGAMRRAGQLFLRLREPFGFYLLAVAGSAGYPPMGDAVDATLAAMVDGVRPDERRGDPEDRGSAGSPRADDAVLHWQHPQQQAYLVLAASSTTDRDGPTSVLLGQVLESSPHREGAAAVGALGTPIHRIWDVALRLWRAGTTDGATFFADTTALAEHLSAMSRRYAETMRTAQANAYLWQHGLAPVDVADLDIAGIACLVARRFPAGVVLDIADRLDPIEAAPIRAGLALSEAAGPPPAGAPG